jgi:hypothetical protein
MDTLNPFMSLNYIIYTGKVWWHIN